jgi:hypothetical protein
VVLVFGRWCADIQERNIMWRLPVRARRGLDELKIENFFHRSPYNVQNVRVWLQDHDAHSWEASHMSPRPFKRRTSANRRAVCVCTTLQRYHIHFSITEHSAPGFTADSAPSFDSSSSDGR